MMAVSTKYRSLIVIHSINQSIIHFINAFHFANALVAILFSQLAASSSASWSLVSQPSSFVNGQVHAIACCVMMKDRDCSALIAYWVVENGNVEYSRHHHRHHHSSSSSSHLHSALWSWLQFYWRKEMSWFEIWRHLVRCFPEFFLPAISSNKQQL